MKKIIMLLSVITLFSVACQEEENLEPNAILEEVQKEPSGQSKASHPPHNRKWFDKGHIWGCTSYYEGNCLGDVIIIPSNLAMANGLITVSSIGNQQNIQSFFSSNENELESILPDYLIDEVISNNLLVSHKTSAADGVATDYILFKNLNDEVEVAVPLVN